MYLDSIAAMNSLVNVNHATKSSGPDSYLRDNCARSLSVYIVRMLSCSLSALSENA